MNVQNYAEAVAANQIVTPPDALKTYVYAVLGIVEEVIEFKAEFYADIFDREKHIEEAGDAMFYYFQFLDRMTNGYKEEFIERFSLDTYFKNPNLLIQERGLTIHKAFDAMVNHAGKFAGIVKKAIRKGDYYIEDKTARNDSMAYLSEVIYNTLIVLSWRNISPELVLEKQWEKSQIRQKQYLQQIEEQKEKTSKKKAVKKEETKEEL